MDWKHAVQFHQPLRWAALDGVCNASDVAEQALGTCSEVPVSDVNGTGSASVDASKVSKSLEPLLNRISTALQEQTKLISQQLEELNLAAIEIGCALCERLFLRVDSAQRIELEELMQAATAQLSASESNTLLLHPTDAERLKEAATSIPAEFTFVADESIEEGNFDFGDPNTGLRFNWSDQLEALRASMITELMDVED